MENYMENLWSKRILLALKILHIFTDILRCVVRTGNKFSFLFNFLFYSTGKMNEKKKDWKFISKVITFMFNNFRSTFWYFVFAKQTITKTAQTRHGTTNKSHVKFCGWQKDCPKYWTRIGTRTDKRFLGFAIAMCERFVQRNTT